VLVIPTVKELNNRVRFCHLPGEKFKTLTINTYIHQNLSPEIASKTALLPAVVERGTKSFPDTISLRRQMENLYGAEISTSVGKKGERHIIAISLEMVRPDFFPGEDLLRQGLQLLKSILNEPLTQNGGFYPAYVEQEKDQLSKEIKGLINDKIGYSVERCIQEMCREERYRVFNYGDLESLNNIDPEGLYHYYLEVIRNNPVDVYMVGPESISDAGSLLEEMLDFPRGEETRQIEPTQVYLEKEREPQFKEEVLPIHQAKLVMGYRTNIDFKHSLYYPLLFFNGVLGGFPHSKLFQNVREKASLAYFVFSRLERHKGLMMTVAGIDYSQYEKTRELIQEQLNEIAQGNITETEMENTRRGLLNQFRVQEDSPTRLISFYLDAHVGGRRHTFEEVRKKISEVTREEVAEVANRVKLDTVYLLRGEAEGK